jgi:YbbR domain-containing protein
MEATPATPIDRPRSPFLQETCTNTPKPDNDRSFSSGSTESLRVTVGRFLTETLGLRFLLALFLSTALWVIITNGRNSSRTDVWQQPIPIEKQGLPSGLTVLGSSLGSVQVRIEANDQTWQRLSLTQFRAFVDLQNAKAASGPQLVPVEVRVSDPAVTLLDWQPASVSVRIEKIEQKSAPVRINVLGSPPAGFTSGKAVSSQDNVTVSGPSSLLANVVEVEADVRIDGANTTQPYTVKLRPKNSQGGDVTDPEVSISPQTIEVTVPVDQQFTTKTVAVVPQRKGAPADGYQILSITPSPDTVTVVGSPTVLAALTTVPTEPVDVTGAVGNLTRSVGLVMPKGVTQLQVEPVQVTAVVTPLQGTLSFSVAPQVIGQDASLIATVVTTSVNVTVQGTVPALQQLQAKDIQLVVDLTGLGPGSYDFTPSARTPSGVTVAKLVPEKVTVTIILPTPTPTPTPTRTPIPPTPVPTRTPTPVPVSATIAPTAVVAPTPTARR